ncbi:hypothetical protein [Listeria booriae]|uniref:hypothetical protein n=1 Tax=Listeria booriae TaxID=1552123 RepID=UPI001625B216|nr:hypothetical protein [Listeria booriae]MBC2173921.1 hypothetical protein [Listeria booriae]
MPKKSLKEKNRQTSKTKSSKKGLKFPWKKRGFGKGDIAGKVFEGERGFSDPFGYKKEDAYLFVGQKKVVSVFDVLIQYGSNSPAPIGWLLQLIPKEEISSGRVIFVQRQKGMEKEKEMSVIEKDIETNIVTMDSSADGRSAKQRAQNASRIKDMALSGQLSGEGDTIIDSDIRLVIKAKTAQKVEETLVALKKNYKHHDVKGIVLVRRTGIQRKEMNNLFSEVTADAWHASDMNSVAAGRLFLPSSGFSDPQGTYVGTDVSALLSNNPAIIDFKGINNAIIFMGGVSAFGSIGGKEGGGLFLNGGSAVAHVISEANYLSGKRIHHIMLSEFGYRAPDSLHFDMSKEAINPLEVFGTPESVSRDATANFNKATTMMLLLGNTVNEQRYAELEVELKSVLINWFISTANNSGMYTRDPEHEPNRAKRILATANHTNYPTPFDFLPALQTNVARRAKEGERARGLADYLYTSMKTTFSEYPNIFHKTTTLPDVFRATDRNIYYDMSKLLDSKNVAGAVFLNVLAYVTNRALEGEQIVIHGLDHIDIPVKHLLAYKERMDKKKIGLITVFERSENAVNPSTFSSFTDRMSRQDAVVLGGITEKELQYINESWRQPLPNQIAQYLLQGNNGLLYFYRKKDRMGALINTHLIL